MRTILNLFLAIILFTSCSSQKLNKERIFGKYQSKKGDPFTELIVSKDKSFTYRQVAGLYDSKSKGVWKLKDKKIVLMSNPAFKTDMIEVSEVDIQKERTINIMDEKNMPYSDVIVKIKHIGNDLVKTTNDKGTIVLDRDINIKSFEVNYLGESYFYDVLKGVSSFVITLYTDNLDKRYFDNEEAILKRKSIILKDIKLSL